MAKNSLIFLLVTAVACGVAHAQNEIAIPMPKSIEVGQCVPVNISVIEMDKQWNLHYRFAQRLKNAPSLAEAEKTSLIAQSLIPEMAQCFSGSGRFSAICFSVSNGNGLRLRAIKLIHSESGTDCLALSTLTKSK